MEEAPGKRNAFASLTEDVFLEILSRLPARSLFCYKCVYPSWNRLISKNRKVLPQSVAGFIYDGENGMRNFTSFTGERPDLSFLPFPRDNVAVLDCCNGLVLCSCVHAAGAESGYVLCNPETKSWQLLPPNIRAVGQARLGFDPRASLDYHVIEFVEDEDVIECLGVEISSSETGEWIYKESEWGQGIDDVIRSRSASVLLNGFLHVMGYSWILAVDMEGKAWRKIRRPPGTLPSVHQSQGHLCVCTVGGVGGHNMSQLSIWILEDYAPNKWTLKHTVSTLKVFAKTNIQFDYVDYESEYTTIVVHPEWNLVFFVGEERRFIAYDMDCRKAHAIPASVFLYGRRSILSGFMSRPYFLPYVPLFLFLKSLAKQ